MQVKFLFIFIWALALVAIFFGSTLPQLATPVKYNLDKLIHFVTYFAIAFAPAWFCKKTWIYIILGVTLILFGIGIEIAQSYIPQRQFSIGDIVANSFGVALGILCCIKIKNIREKL